MTPVISIWPALNTDAAPAGGTLQYMRAVRGKVHRAASDYRWIAVTPGLDPQSLQILQAVALGPEDHPVDLVAWVALERGYLAMHAYPSRARDAAGRSAGLEKQVAFWNPDASGVPAAAAAFFLLEVSQKFDDSVWWSSWERPEWSQAAFVLPLDRNASPPIPWDAARLRTRIEQGVADLRSKVGEESLARFYQEMIEGARPALLKVSSAPISPAALASLLLPLPYELAQKISLAGGLPMADVRPSLLENWAGVACAGIDDSGPAAGEQARSWARALLAGNPRSLGLRPLAETAPHPEISLRPTAESPASARYLRDFLASDSRSLADPASDGAAWVPIEGADLDELIEKIQRLDKESANSGRFARDPQRRDALQLHLRLKGDLARAWLYAQAPGKVILERLPPRADARVPALWFAPVVPRPARSWERYSPSGFEGLVVHSLVPERRRLRVVEWLEAFRDGGFSGERLAQLIRASR